MTVDHSNISNYHATAVANLISATFFLIFPVSPSIDKGGTGSKTVKVNRSAIWHIKVRGEPPPVFSWYKDGRKLENSEEFLIESDEYQGGATAMFQVLRTQVMSDKAS